MLALRTAFALRLRNRTRGGWGDSIPESLKQGDDNDMKTDTKIRILAALGLIAVATPLTAAIRPYYQDVHFPTQKMIEYQAITAPAVADTTGILNANTGPTSAAAKTLTTGWTNPDVPRNIVITPGTSTAQVQAGCRIRVTGTDIFDASLTEDFLFTAAQSSASTGSYAFKTITQIDWTANCENGSFSCTWSFGQGSKLGLKRCMALKSDFMYAALNGTYEGTRPTIVANTTQVSANTIQLSSSLNSVDVQAYFIQNFGCFP